MTAVRPVSQRGDAQRRGGETRNVSRSNYAANGCSVKPGGTPRTSHTATPRALCSRRGCASRSKTPLRWRAPRSLWLNPASLRALFAVHGASFGHESFTHFAGWFSLFQDCQTPALPLGAAIGSQPRQVGASTRRTFSSGDRQLTTGVFPSARPRRRDPPRPRPLPRAHPSPHGVPHRLPACPACARRLAEPARFPPRPLAPPPLRPPRISSPRHAR